MTTVRYRYDRELGRHTILVDDGSLSGPLTFKFSQEGLIIDQEHELLFELWPTWGATYDEIEGMLR